MNWFDKIEQDRKLIIGGLVVICVALLAVSIRLDNIANDSFWHVKIPKLRFGSRRNESPFLTALKDGVSWRY